MLSGKALETANKWMYSMARRCDSSHGYESPNLLRAGHKILSGSIPSRTEFAVCPAIFCIVGRTLIKFVAPAKYGAARL